MKNPLPLAALAGLALAAGSAHGALLSYEGFDYTPTDEELIGKGGTTEDGLGGTWANADDDSNMFLEAGSLSFGDQQTSGNHIRYIDNSDSDRYNRGITANLSGGNELWFSFLGNKTGGVNWGAGRGGLANTNGTVSDARFDQVSATGLHGFGIATTIQSSGGSADTWTAWGWDGTNAVTSTVGHTVADDGSETSLLVGQVAYGAGTGGLDVFSFYNYVLNNGSVVGGTNNLITSIEVDADETLLDTLNITRQVNKAYDEVRIGTSLDDVVVAVPEPSAFALLAGCFGLAWIMVRRR